MNGWIVEHRFGWLFTDRNGTLCLAEYDPKFNESPSGWEIREMRLEHWDTYRMPDLED